MDQKWDFPDLGTWGLTPPSPAFLQKRAITVAPLRDDVAQQHLLRKYRTRRPPTEKFAEPCHERVAQPTEQRPVPNFLREQVADVALARDVEDLESAITAPFPCGVVVEFQVAEVLRRHVVAPLDAGLIVVVHLDRGFTVLEVDAPDGKHLRRSCAPRG